MTASATNWVGSITIASNAVVDLFAASGMTSAATAGEWTVLPGLNQNLAQVNTSTYSTSNIQMQLQQGRSYKTGGTAFYVQNNTGASVTFTARFASIL